MAVLAAAAAGNPRIIIDLAALEYIDCHALGALVRVRAQARQAGGDLLLAAPRGPVRRLLDLTGLTGVFSVHASVDEAVRTTADAPPRGNRRVTGTARPVMNPPRGGQRAGCGAGAGGRVWPGGVRVVVSPVSRMSRPRSSSAAPS